MDNVTIPTLFSVQQSLPKGDSLDIDRTLAADWERLNLGEQVAGKRIALGFGSRGVSSIDIIAKKLVAPVTSGKMALLHGRRFVGIDISAEYVDIARRRLEESGLAVCVDGVLATFD